MYIKILKFNPRQSKLSIVMAEILQFPKQKNMQKKVLQKKYDFTLEQAREFVFRNANEESWTTRCLIKKEHNHSVQATTKAEPVWQFALKLKNNHLIEIIVSQQRHL